ncbi:MAG: cadmium-translocating P-type ATPase [Spirochaetes bacterium]|nr:cadmium-translocating P-type ATPase [Spirochaetota bacterium]
MEKNYTIKNLDCAHCANKVEKHIQKLPYVNGAVLNFATSTLKIHTENIEGVKKEIQKIEPGLELSLQKDHSEKEPIKQSMFYFILLFGIFFTSIVFENFLKRNLSGIPYYFIFLSIYLFAGFIVIKNAVLSILKGQVFNEHFLMTIATLGAIAIQALPEAAGVMLFYKLGVFFEDLAVKKSRKSIKSLLALKPDYVNIKQGDTILKTNPEEAKIGDIIIVKPGERVPLDGKVLNGQSLVDTSALTGESVPRNFKKDDEILSGMIVTTSTLTIAVTKLFSESSISRILSLVENAISKKAKMEKFITTFARYYTPFIVLLAIGISVIPPFVLNIGGFNQWFYRALVILVISCPCALVISIPLGYFGGLGAASNRGILIKGSNFIDVLNNLHTVVFDKTGTLTKGIFSVTKIVSRNGFSEDELLKYAAYAEAHSNHPIAISIKDKHHTKIDESAIKNYKEITGYGVIVDYNNKEILLGNDKLLHKENIEHTDCELDETVVYLAIDKKYAGYIIISDDLKEDAEQAIGDLKNMGIKSHMLTGDNFKIAKTIAGKLNISEFHAELLPDEKLQELEKIMDTQSGKVAFIGDGINDAPVIARSDVGFAMGALGTDAAIETADVVLMNDNPLKIVEAIKISKKTRSIIVQNIYIALLIKIIFIALGTTGIAGMWEAVFGDVGVTLLAIFNSLRLTRKANR